MSVKQFFLDLILEKRGGKASTKKIWGHLILLLVSTTYVMDGWDFYVINEHLFDAMLIAGTTLIGAATLAGIFSKSKKDEEASDDK